MRDMLQSDEILVAGDSLSDQFRTPLTTSAARPAERRPGDALRARFGARAGAFSGNGCGRRWRRSRRRSGCSWPVLARAVAVAAADRSRDRARCCSFCSARRRWCRCCCCACRAASRLAPARPQAGLPHRPATAIADEIAGETEDRIRGRAVARPCRARAARRQDAPGRDAGAAACGARSRWRCARWWWCWWLRRSSPPAAIA